MVNGAVPERPVHHAGRAGKHCDRVSRHLQPEQPAVGCYDELHRLPRCRGARHQRQGRCDQHRWDATADEVSAAIASHASETNDTSKEIWWKNGYEIVRTGEHSYTYAHLTPLCFSDVSRTDGTDDKEWAIQATADDPADHLQAAEPECPESPDTGQKPPRTEKLTRTTNRVDLYVQLDARGHAGY